MQVPLNGCDGEHQQLRAHRLRCGLSSREVFLLSLPMAASPFRLTFIQRTGD